MLNNNKLERRFQKTIVPLYEITYRYLLRLGCNNILAEDIVQETMKSAWENYEFLDSINYHENWLKTVARNKYYSYQRLAFNKYEYCDSEIELTSDECNRIEQDVCELLTKLESYEELELALSMIDEKYSNLIRMRFFGELTYNEISQNTGLNINTVRSAVSRSLIRLNTILNDMNKSKEGYNE